MSNLGITPLSNSVYATSKNQSAKNVNFRGTAEIAKSTAKATEPATGKILKNVLFAFLTMVGVVATGTVFNSCKNKTADVPIEVPVDVPLQTINFNVDPNLIQALSVSSNDTAQYILDNINPKGYTVENRDGKLYLQNVSDEEAKKTVKAMLLIYDNTPENIYHNEKAFVHSLAETYLEPENEAVGK